MPPKKKIKADSKQQQLKYFGFGKTVTDVREETNASDQTSASQATEEERREVRDVIDLDMTGDAPDPQPSTSCDNAQTKQAKPAEKEESTTTRKFVQAWTLSFKWLRYENEKMFCTACNNGNMKNAFTSGCINFRKSALSDNEVTKEHRDSLKVPALQKNTEEIAIRLLSAQEKGAAVAIRAAYWIIKENLACSKFKSLLNLLKSVETPFVKEIEISESTKYESTESFYVLLS